MDYLILLSSIALGVVTVFAFKLTEARHVRLLNAFTGAYLLCLTLLHLLPELYHNHDGLAHRSELFIGAWLVTSLGFEVTGTAGKDFAAYLDRDRARWSKVIAERKLTLD